MPKFDLTKLLYLIIIMVVRGEGITGMTVFNLRFHSINRGNIYPVVHQIIPADSKISPEEKKSTNKGDLCPSGNLNSRLCYYAAIHIKCCTICNVTSLSFSLLYSLAGYIWPPRRMHEWNTSTLHFTLVLVNVTLEHKERVHWNACSYLGLHICEKHAR